MLNSNIYFFFYSVGINDLGDALEELLDVNQKWFEIGLKLNVPPGTLENFKTLEPTASMHEMLFCWLRETNPPPTWEALADALKSHTVGEAELAQRLRSKYCVPIPGMCTR